MKKNSIFLILLFVLGCAQTPYKKDVIFQNAPINSLMAGCYTGSMSIGGLKDHGNFGLGTVDALDGEMIVLGGNFYQIRSNGEVNALKDNDTSPFATLTFFNAEQNLDPEKPLDFNALKTYLDEELPSSNLLYAIKVEGRFSTIKVRSVARQDKPYPILTEAIGEQKICELKDREGTLVGFRFPPYMTGVNAVGYHFHFLSKDKRAGGHVLDFQTGAALIKVDNVRNFLMELPENKEFLEFHSGIDSSQAIAKVEK